MQKKEQSRNKRIKDKWFIYILQCKDSSFYTGITKDLERRIKMHNDGKASRYTRIRRPVVLLYQETCLGRTKSLIRECEIKALPRKKKEGLIAKEPL
ncbi:MAG: GIY-YIG nuclease family protein [Candidatus Omnitrophota bacterium]